MKIKTNEFIHILSKAIKGAGNNKLIPITSMLGIKAHNDFVDLYTTDSSNYLRVRGRCEDVGDIEVTVPAIKFATLISRMTCDTVKLEIKDGNLEVVGNGRYVIELPVDESGELIVFPNPAEKFHGLTTARYINTSDIVVIKNSLAPALATTTEVLCYCSYYFGDMVIATDTYKIASIDKKLFDSILLTPQLINLLTLTECETVDYNIIDNEIYFTADDIAVYGHLSDGIEDYAVDAITGLINDSFPYECKIAKDKLISALNRTSLFVDKYDKNAVRMIFGDSGLIIESRKEHSQEVIKYESHIEIDVDTFSCFIDVDMLMSQLKAYDGNIITIQFGKDSSIKLIGFDTVQIISLLSE